MFKAIRTINEFARSAKIVIMLRDNNNFVVDVERDDEIVSFIRGMIRYSDLNNKEIAQEVLELHTIGRA